jgi:hypothetical protein
MKLVLVGLLAAAAVASAQAQSSARPTLGVVDHRPFVVRGTGFQPNERIALLLASARMWKKTVVATNTGSFRTRFAISLPRCQRYALHAFGSQGSRARTHSGVQVDCVPPSSGS